MACGIWLRHIMAKVDNIWNAFVLFTQLTCFGFGRQVTLYVVKAALGAVYSFRDNEQVYMAGKLKLDNVDLQILQGLQDDGRMTNVELAKRAGISAPPCLRRVRALEKAGVVRGYHADLDAEALGYNVHVFAFVGLASQAEVDLQAFEGMVAHWPQVRECHMLMGEIDFLLKIVAHDWDDFQKFLTSKLTPAKNVSHVKTALSIRSAKKLAGVPVVVEPTTD